MGIGTSAIKSFCDYCYSERNIDSLIIRISPDNHISSHIFKKLGARYLEKKIPPELAEVYEKMGTQITNEMLDLYGADHYLLTLPLQL